MTSLTYRGTTYVQSKEIAEKQQVELTYRRNVYNNRINSATNKSKAELNYRGVNYKK